MKHEHRECDNKFAEAEGLVAEAKWAEANDAYLAFANETLSHFKKEEDILFPEFEKQTGSAQGPTQVMVFEHEQVRGLIGKLAGALEDKDRDAYLSLAESMMILLQQHNMKEEQMLYAMCDRVIPQETREELIDSMKQVSM
jgi:hemerythrin-like domain-containing protein